MTVSRQNPVASGMGKLVGRLMIVPRVILGSLILFSIALNFANVIGRYIFFSPIIWAEEVMIFIMVWCVFIGSILVSWDGRHLKMDLLSSYLKPPWKQMVNAFSLAVFLFVCAIIVTQSYKVVTLFARFGQESTVAAIPMVIPHSALLIGFGLMIFGVAVRYRDHISGRLGDDVNELIEDLPEDEGATSGQSWAKGKTPWPG